MTWKNIDAAILKDMIMAHVDLNESIIEESNVTGKQPERQMAYLYGRREALNDALQAINELVD